MQTKTDSSMVSLSSGRLHAEDCSWAILAVAIYYLSNPHNSPFDYTLRIAEALFAGQLGVRAVPPPWLNEFVPWGEWYYSVFPLGAVLCMFPVAVVRIFGEIGDNPSRVLVALLAAVLALAANKLLRADGSSDRTRRVLVIFLLFGNWLWCNSAFGGAWQIALLWSAIGQILALYFIFGRLRPLLAGAAFAAAFGNRTEVLLTAPLFFLLVAHRTVDSHSRLLNHRAIWALAKFCVVPFCLGVLTLVYNYARFGSLTDFGYTHIPGVLEEPWYRDGLFALSAFPRNAQAMLFEPWIRKDFAPYLFPNPFGCSVFLSAPFLFLLFRIWGSAAKGSVRALAPVRLYSWIAIAVLTAVLWAHGNTGGWQYSYRYATVLLPWMLLILSRQIADARPLAIYLLLGCSVILSTYGTYLFYWTDLLPRVTGT